MLKNNEIEFARRKSMNENKKQILIIVISLLIAAILMSVLLSVVKKDWIVLLFVIAYGIFFSKCLNSDFLFQWLNEKFSSKKLNIIGIVCVGIALALLPQSFGEYMFGIVEFLAYCVSFVLWMSGMVLIENSHRQKYI
jgi:FtsH-binding integral membrane protein